MTPQLASGGTTPKKPEIQPVRKIRTCFRSPQLKIRTKRQISPGDTPGREEVVRHEAAPDGMDEEIVGWSTQWQLAAVEPRKELFF